MLHMTKSQPDQINAEAIIKELVNASPRLRLKELQNLLKKYTKGDGKTFSKSELLAACKGDLTVSADIKQLLQKKPIRTLSGVTPVTVLTKPFPCPGNCIFCPSDVRMPKSYIANEPGAQRAGQYAFHPYAQMYNRLVAFQETGHPVSKIEVIVLGGTWSAYSREYQYWFIAELFKAMNDFGEGKNNCPHTDKIDTQESLPDHSTYNEYIRSKQTTSVDQVSNLADVHTEQKKNETSKCRCVGLVLETRPDCVSEAEVVHLRQLGATKIQIGIQSLQNDVLELNRRGHTAEATILAIHLLRSAGFKIHGHWMPNLYGSSPEKDIQDYVTLFESGSACPDELKIYPCSLIDHTGLMTIYKQGKWLPYTRSQLLEVLTFVLTQTPEYCRLTRIVRDIPGTEIVAGNKTTNLRQILDTPEIRSQSHDIRAREIKNQSMAGSDPTLDDVMYETSNSTEHFLQYIMLPERKIFGFLRLSLPKSNSFIPELEQAAIIREIHIYGRSVSVGDNSEGASQHQGLGKSLISKATAIAKEAGYQKIAVISAVGTKPYYRDNGFVDGQLYQFALIK